MNTSDNYVCYESPHDGGLTNQIQEGLTTPWQIYKQIDESDSKSVK